MLPGPIVEIVDGAPAAATLTDTGTRFTAGLAHKGATTGQLTAADAVHSLAEWITKYGARQVYNGPEYDSADAFFSEGGTRMYFSRIAGPAAVRASAAVPAASSKFTATAKGPGTYANGYTVAVASGVVTVRDAGGVILEVSPALADTAAAQTWASETGQHIDITPLAAGALTDSVAVTLAAGADDRTNITDIQRQAALDRLGKDLGPGNVDLAGDSRSAAHTMLAQHALDRNRFAYADAPDTATAATVIAAGLAIRALGRDRARHIQLLDNWLVAGGTTAGTTRTVPPSGVQAGMAARSDARGNPNRAVAGRNGYSGFAIALKHPRTDADRGLLADAGVTVYTTEGSRVQCYDDLTPVDPVLEPEWLGAAANRFVMRVVADALEIANAHMFGSVSGPVDLVAFNGDLKGMLADWYALGALYGATPGEAYRVETGPAINTPATLQARQLRAALALKISPNARQVVINITNTPLTAAL
ncbi:MAG: hypothetical protein WKF48_05750 [Solirubrobacteraceae bacterium]